MLGTNDCKTLYHADAETIADGMESLVEVVRTFDPKIEIVVVSPIALGEGVGAEGYDPEFNENSVWVSRGLPETYRQVAQKWNSHFLAASDYAKPSVTDREHMDVEGHYHFAKGIGDLIEKIIRKQEQNRNLLSVS